MTFKEYIEIADKKFQDGLYEEAIKDYDKAIELNPKDDYAYYKRGISKADFGNIVPMHSVCDRTRCDIYFTQVSIASLILLYMS